MQQDSARQVQVHVKWLKINHRVELRCSGFSIQLSTYKILQICLS